MEQPRYRIVRFILAFSMITNLIFICPFARVNAESALEPIVESRVTDIQQIPIASKDAQTEILQSIEEPESEPEPPVEEIVEESPIHKKSSNTVYLDIPLSEDLQSHIFALCEERGLDYYLVMALIYRESGFDVDALGGNGSSVGLMQIQPRWHTVRAERLGCNDLMDPYQNVMVGIDLLAGLAGSGYGDEWVLMAYNGGSGSADRNFAQGIVTDYALSVLYIRDCLKN